MFLEGQGWEGRQEDEGWLLKFDLSTRIVVSDKISHGFNHFYAIFARHLIVKQYETDRLNFVLVNSEICAFKALTKRTYRFIDSFLAIVAELATLSLTKLPHLLFNDGHVCDWVLRYDYLL